MMHFVTAFHANKQIQGHHSTQAEAEYQSVSNIQCMGVKKKEEEYEHRFEINWSSASADQSINNLKTACAATKEY